MFSSLMPNYKRIDLAFTHGEGPWLISTTGRRYLDFGAGIAVSSLGHHHPRLISALKEQASKLLHVSNLYHIPEAEYLAQQLVHHSFADSVLFCNSGAEANEGLVKIIRRAHYKNGHPQKNRIICFEGAFHGRTLAMIAATGNPTYLEGFAPHIEGFDHVPYNNLEAVKAAITPQTAGILLEPIQGESGIKPATISFLQGLRALCDTHGLYLGIDEVQTGMGRTGKLFAHEYANIKPDILSTAKGIGGGFPLGAVLARKELAQHLTPGTHGTTYGGNPMACVAGRVVLEELTQPGKMEQIAYIGDFFGALLLQVVEEFPKIFSELRGIGLMRGLKCHPPVADVLQTLLQENLLAVSAGDNVLRLVPPLIITEAECHEAIIRLRRAASLLMKEQKKSL